MQTQGNTILITGGGSGIGRGLAEAFHKLGNQVIIAGRRRSALDEVTGANPGLRAIPLDIEHADAIAPFAEQVAREYPSLNVVIHNAGIMRQEKLASPGKSLADCEAIVNTNLLGPMRLHAALYPILQRQARSTIITVTSGLAFVPYVATPTYCASKAAVHAWTMSLRRQLRGTSTQVIELIPPYVQTHLNGPQQASDPQAMPLDAFIKEVMSILTSSPDATEVVVERCKPLRYAAETGKLDAVFDGLNASRGV